MAPTCMDRVWPLSRQNSEEPESPKLSKQIPKKPPSSTIHCFPMIRIVAYRVCDKTSRILRKYRMPRRSPMKTRGISRYISSDLTKRFKFPIPERAWCDSSPMGVNDGRKRPRLTKKPRLLADKQEFKSILSPELMKLSQLFVKHGFQLRIAGGAVRDLLMEKTPHDIDLATTATPDQMKAMFEEEKIRMINTNGEKHGTITARIDDKDNFEVTTLRIDKVTDGRHAEVEFTQDWELDANRRDLTINSMFLDLEGSLFDYFNGEGDLVSRKVRFVGDPGERIREDYLRILRFFRFYGRIVEEADFSKESETIESIKQSVDGLEKISGERLWVELKKILVGKFAPEIMKKMLECGIGRYVGLGDIEECEEMVKVYKNAIDLSPNPITILVSIITKMSDMDRVHKRLKLSKHELNIGRFIIEHRDEFNRLIEPSKQNRDEGESSIDHRDEESEVELMKFCRRKCAELNQKDPKVKEKMLELLKYLGRRSELDELSKWEIPKFPVNGRSLVEKGVKGKDFTKLLDFMRDSWIDGDFKKSEVDLLKEMEAKRSELAS